MTPTAGDQAAAPAVVTVTVRLPACPTHGNSACLVYLRTDATTNDQTWFCKESL